MPTSMSSCMRTKVTGRMQRRLGPGLRVRILLLVLDFFGRLPEEQVRADRDSKHRHNDRKIVTRELDVRHDEVLRNGPPVPLV